MTNKTHRQASVCVFLKLLGPVTPVLDALVSVWMQALYNMWRLLCRDYVASLADDGACD